MSVYLLIFLLASLLRPVDFFVVPWGKATPNNASSLSPFMTQTIFASDFIDAVHHSQQCGLVYSALGLCRAGCLCVWSLWLDWLICLPRHHPVLPPLAPLQVVILSHFYPKPMWRFFPAFPYRACVTFGSRCRFSSPCLHRSGTVLHNGKPPDMDMVGITTAFVQQVGRCAVVV